MASKALMHLSAAIPGGDPGDIRGLARDLLAFVANVWALPRQDTRGKTRGICNIAAILKMKDPDLGNGFQNGVGEIKRL